MRVDVMTDKGEVSFAEECKHLLDLCDEICTKGDKKHAKREAKARLKHKYYWVNKEEDILFNSMKDVYKILNHQDKVTMKQFYYIRCDPDLYEGLCAMRRISCACAWYVEQLSNPWLPNLYKILQPCYSIKPKTCKYFSILSVYNKWYITLLTFKTETTNPDDMEIKYELVLDSMSWAAADDI